MRGAEELEANEERIESPNPKLLALFGVLRERCSWAGIALRSDVSTTALYG
jgi:hypothetical protein